MSRNLPASALRPEVSGFLADIKDAPEEDTPRLIFADWLEEQGDPRGEFMRVQCQLARLVPGDPHVPELREREGELREENVGAWLGRLPRGCTPKFQRGLLHLNLPHRTKALLGEQLRNWAQSEAATWLEAIEFYAYSLSTEDLATILEMLPAVCVHLNWYGPNANPDSALAFAQLPVLSRLRELHLKMSDLGAAGTHALVTSPHLQQLRILNLSFNELEDNALTAFLGAALPRLTWLDVSGNNASGKMLAALRDRFGDCVRV